MRGDVDRVGEDEVGRHDGWGEVLEGWWQACCLGGRLRAVQMDALLRCAHCDPLSRWRRGKSSIVAL